MGARRQKLQFSSLRWETPFSNVPIGVFLTRAGDEVRACVFKEKRLEHLRKCAFVSDEKIEVLLVGNPLKADEGCENNHFWTLLQKTASN